MKCVVPGTFDPVTNGHLDVIKRATKLFDEVIVAIAESKGKQPLFDLETRKSFVECACKNFKNVSVEAFDGLLIDFVKDHNAQCVVKGIRNSADFDYEQQMAFLNETVSRKFETCFLMTSPKNMAISSSKIKEFVHLNADVSMLVPDCVCEALNAKLNANKKL